MLAQKKNTAQLGFFSTFRDQLNHKHPLYVLAGQIDWQYFQDAFAPLYCPDNGRPAKPIRLMVGLLMLKHIRNVSDESIVEQWAENSYYQHFCGEDSFVPGEPCEASELVHFRNRIGPQGIELIFRESIRVNGADAEEPCVKADTTVQEKNVEFPTDAKMHRKIIGRCRKISLQQGLPVRQSYTRTLRRLGVDQRFRSHPKQRSKALRADRKVRTIAGRLVREVVRNLPLDSPHHDDLALYRRVLAQRRKDSDKVYSLHEPDVKCISRGKDHKKYEFGNKVSLTVTEKSGVIVGALSFSNPYDGHTLPAVIEQYESIFGRAPSEITVDRGYRGRVKIGQTTINIPKPFNDKKLSRYRQNKLRHKFRRRAAIEPVIGHVKSDHRVGRNYYKGIVGDQVNVLLGAAAFNFKRMLNKYKEAFGPRSDWALLGRFIFWVRANFWAIHNAPETSVVHSVSKGAF